MSLAELDQQLVELQLQYADQYIPMASGITQDDINAIIAEKGGSQLGQGAFGEASPVTYKGKEYLRKAMRFLTIEPFTKETFDNEVRLMKLLVANPRTRPYVPFFYGSAIGSTPAGKPVGYIVMERLVGMTLENLMTQRFFLKDEYDLLMSQITDILTIFHDEGFLHRDLHPQNIFVIMNGNEIVAPVLIDFGLSTLQKRKTSYNSKENKVKHTRNGDKQTLQDRLRNPYERGYRTNKSQLADYSREFPAFKPRDFEAMTLTAEQKATLAPLEERIEAIRSERDAVLAATQNERRTTWLQSLLANNVEKKNRYKNELFTGTRMRSTFRDKDKTGSVIPQLDAFVKDFTVRIFDILRSNGVILEKAIETAKTFRDELQDLIVAKLSWDMDPSQTFEEGYAASKGLFEAKALELEERAKQIKTPTSFYGGRKLTRRRKPKKNKTRRSKY